MPSLYPSSANVCTNPGGAKNRLCLCEACIKTHSARVGLTIPYTGFEEGLNSSLPIAPPLLHGTAESARHPMFEPSIRRSVALIQSSEKPSQSSTPSIFPDAHCLVAWAHFPLKNGALCTAVSSSALLLRDMKKKSVSCEIRPCKNQQEHGCGFCTVFHYWLYA